MEIDFKQKISLFIMNSYEFSVCFSSPLFLYVSLTLYGIFNFTNVWFASKCIEQRNLKLYKLLFENQFFSNQLSSCFFCSLFLCFSFSLPPSLKIV